VKISIVGFVAAALLCAATLVQAQYPDAGNDVMQMLKLEYSAREASMAGAAVGMPGGIDGAGANPAVIAFIPSVQGSLGFRKHVLDVWGLMLSGAMNLNPYGVVAGSLLYSSQGEVDESVRQGDKAVYTGRTWGAYDVMGSVGWGRVIAPGFGVGVVTKGLYSLIRTSDERYVADGFATDAGIQYRMLRDRLIVGAAVRNIGFLRRSFEREDTYTLPRSIAAGISIVPRYTQNLRLALDVEKKEGDYITFEPALAVSLLEDMLVVRGGFSFSERDMREIFKSMQGEGDSFYQKSNWKLLCLGASFSTKNLKNLTFDSGVEFHSQLPPSLVFSLGVSL
jgi:hypothetical protein